ncbi:LAFA_0G17634g1_1 [Lachancea sp. 'fantastica']|nr:LAFA_0G17634g1_1 [Lachancea sp. 'fantastica']
MGDVQISSSEEPNSARQKKNDQITERNRQFDSWTSKDFKNGVYQLFRGKQDASDRIGNELLMRRALDDSAESRDFLITQFRENIDTGLAILGSWRSGTADILFRCFEEQKASNSLVLEVIRILELKEHKRADTSSASGSETHNNSLKGSDISTPFLFTVAAELVSKFNLDFDTVKPLVKMAVLRSHGQVEPIKLLHAMVMKYGEQFQIELLNVFTSLLQEGLEKSDLMQSYLINVVSVLKALYLQATAFCTELFLSEQFQTVAQTNFFKTSQVTSSILDLMSTACIDSVARNYIAEKYFTLLSECLSVERYKFAASLVLLKTWNFTKLKGDAVDDMASTLIKQLNMPKKQQKSMDSLKQDELAVEGLAYLTLKASVKMLLFSNSDFLDTLIEYLGEENTPNSMYYGILVILGNLSDLQSSSTSAGKSIEELKARAEPSTMRDGEKTNIKDETVLKFISECILSRDVIGIVKRHIKSRKMQGTGSHHQLLRLIFSAAQNKAYITTLVSQGSVTVLLESLALSNIPSEVRVLALRALARTLTAVNPQLVFKEYSALNALPFLFELIPDPEMSSESHLQIKDTYESLLALTNLATLSEGAIICEKIMSVAAYWDKLENLMLDSVVENQRSTLELFSNMMASSLRVAVKFFNFQNPLSVRNFKILVKLLHLDDRKSRLAVAAIFANIATSVPFIAEELARQPELIKNSIELLEDQKGDAEMRHRLIVLFDALIGFGLDTEAFSSQKSELKKALSGIQNEEPSSSEYSISIRDMLAKL